MIVIVNVTPSVLLADPPPLELGYAEPSAWLKHEGTGVFCVCPPDLIFVLKRRGGYMWVYPEFQYPTLETDGMSSEGVQWLSEDVLDACKALSNGVAPAGQVSVVLCGVATDLLGPTSVISFRIWSRACIENGARNTPMVYFLQSVRMYLDMESRPRT
ncbi:hypothetical protein H2248_008648 [Termitomyces sp. 'cryptogamus']|nr:hypothetical protein H2248_008648 [Termitomyces sp. 'cryptogamus']